MSDIQIVALIFGIITGIAITITASLIVYTKKLYREYIRLQIKNSHLRNQNKLLEKTEINIGEKK